MENWKLLSHRLKWAVDQKLRAEPSLRKITNKALAKIAGVSPPAVGYWYRDANGMEAEPARKLGVFLGVDAVWLEKGDGPPPSFTLRQDMNTPSEDIFALVPELDVKAACGPGGKFTDHVVVKGGLAFKHSFLSEVGVPEDQARVVHADGPSMEPTIGHGRVVLVNLADTVPKDGKVYLICDEDGGISLKRLVRDFDPGMGATVWKIRSDNPDKRRYPDKFWPEDSRAHIIGRAVWHDGLL